MASQTTHLHLIKPAENELYKVADQNNNMDILDEEVNKRGKTLNGKAVDENGNWNLNEVDFAHQIVTEDAQQMSGEFLFRTTGGNASISDGPAKLVSIFGRRTHTGVTPETLTLTVNEVPRGEGEDGIQASIDHDTFVAYVSTSSTITLTYTDAWNVNPSLYGVTVTGTPVSGDQMVIVYVKENRGTITQSNPETFISTGWNLYNHTAGYAKVKKYSESYGFLIGGTYTALQFSETLEGTKTTITPAAGYFTVPSDGYVWVTGGTDDNTGGNGTYILMTWSNWGEGYPGTWQAYTEDVIDMSMLFGEAQGNETKPFPYGLMQVESVSDEINFGMEMAISWIERMDYTAANLATAKASGRPWEADDDYIYIVKAVPDVYMFTDLFDAYSSSDTYDVGDISTQDGMTYRCIVAISTAEAFNIAHWTEYGNYNAYDHGEEIITGSDVAVFVESIYGQNLVDKLRTDVVTKSQDLVNVLTSDATDKALTAAQGKALKEITDTLNSNLTKKTISSNIADSSVVESGSVIVEAIGNIVFIRFVDVKTKTDVAANAEVVVGNIPSGYRPSSGIYGTAKGASGGVGHDVLLSASINGNVGMTNKGSGSSRMYANGYLMFFA